MPSKFITINVTARDIKYGEPGKADQCPIQRAISRTKFGKLFHSILVGGSDILFDSRLWVNLPSPARYFVKDFDHDVPVEPFTFKLEVPDTDAE